MRTPLVSACLLAVAALLGSSTVLGPPAAGAADRSTRPSVARAAATTTHHFVTNLHGAVAGPRAVGFTVFDSGAAVSTVNALPSGVQALVWLGQKCPTPADDSFRSTVRSLAANPKVFGYYLSDEPHLADCPDGPAALATRARFVADTAGGRQLSFIVLSKEEDYAAFRPVVSRVSMVGLDPYPCSVAHLTCQPSKIDEKVALAVSHGIPVPRIVPVYQAFGQTATSSHYYNLPTAAQMRTMIARWVALVPHPQMDYAYGWGHQSSSNPTLIDSPSLQGVFTSYFAG